MKIEKFIETTEGALKNLTIKPDNLISAITKLLEIIHAHGLDADAIKALSECGIALELSEE